MLMIFLLLIALLQAIVPPESLPELIEFVLGAFASIVVQFVKGKFQSRTARFGIAIALSVFVGIASYVIAKPEDTDLVVFVIHVFAYAQIAYNVFWKLIWEEMFGFKKFGAR